MEEGRRVVQFGDSVVFDYAGYHLTAGRMALDEAVGRAWADGGVTLSGPAASARATRVWIELATERVILEDLEARLGPWSARAKRAELLGERIDLYDAVLTACPTPNPLYSLRAAKLSKESQVKFVASGVVPYFYFVPFFYLPRYTYELEREEGGDTLVPGRQGFEFNPGRGNFSGLFVKTTWRKKFFERKLLSTLHLDYYSNPGPAVGEELQYRSKKTDHYTFAYFTRTRKITQDGSFNRLPGRENRWRAWQVWSRKFPFGHFKSYVNEVSDSVMEENYRFNFDERRLREREINTELVYQKPAYKMKLFAERLQTLDTDGPKEYRLERRVVPAFRFLTYPVPISAKTPKETRGWRFYALADAMAAAGRDQPNRPDGAMGDGRIAAITTVPLASRLSATGELSVQSMYRDKKVSPETGANTQIGGSRLTFHRPWLGEWLKSDVGYAVQKAWTNKGLYADNGMAENRLFLSLRNFHRLWKTSLDAGYDFRENLDGLSTIDFQTRYAGGIGDVSTIVRYDPQKNRAQSVYGSAAIKFGSLLYAGIGIQTVHTDSEVQVQFTPAARFETKTGEYRYGFAGFYDAKSARWRTRDFYLTKMFDCVETTLRVSKREADVQFNFSFRLTGFKNADEVLRRAERNPSAPNPAILSP